MPADYHHDEELAVFHEVIAMEVCMRRCKEKEVRGIISECISVRL